MPRLWSGLLAVTALAAIALLVPTASHAETYPWCAQYGDDSGAQNCGFTTFEQCRRAIAGNAGFCVRNPYYSDKPEASDGPKRKKR